MKTTPTPELIVWENKGIQYSLKPIDNEDYVIAEINNYIIRFYMPFKMALMFLKKRPTKRQLFITPTYTENEYIAELQKDEIIVHNRVWAYNGKHWFDVQTGLRIAPYTPNDEPVKNKLPELEKFPQIPNILLELRAKKQTQQIKHENNPT